MDVELLLTKRELDPSITKEAFREDVECLFLALETAYGAYDYFGAERFQTAKKRVMEEIGSAPFEFPRAVEILKKHLYAMVRDGHFTIGKDETVQPGYDYAVRYGEWNGIPVIDCKKFWFDTEQERLELEAFVRSAERFRNDEPLIVDVRDNPGGSDQYIYDFIRNLFGVEPSYPCKFRQRNSPLFLAYLAGEGITPMSVENPQVEEDDGLTIHSKKPIYVLFNENTHSSGESAIAYLKTVTSTIAVGDHSGGSFSCGNCVRIYLPNSHLSVYFGTGLVLYEKTRNIDAEGGFRGDISMERFTRWLAELK